MRKKKDKLMRAVVCNAFGPFENMSVENISVPAPRAGQLAINVKAAGVSFAQSLLVTEKYQRKPPLPFVPGAEVAGTVAAIGDGVDGYDLGTPVYAAIDWGGFAELAIAKAMHCFSIPKNLSFEQATLFPISYPTSYAALIWKAKIQESETVLVHGGAGAVGSAAIGIAKVRGAKVIATAGSSEKCKIAANHGADLTINYTTENFRDIVKDWTGGKGVDVVIDPVGGDVGINSLRAMGRESRLITLGFASGVIPKPPINLLLVKNMSIIGLNYGTYLGWSPGDDGSRYEDNLSVLHTDLCTMMANGMLAPKVSHRFPLAEFNTAMDTVLRRQSTGKVVLNM
ncbi:MAG: hypothetical protein CBB68_05530 [Rhodospirillaceae bacterium TMED8]|nr:NADPH:quinone oxidoreductase [Magnetovibrio sp.]OUT51455.1 MAG: hypothetical protein CBB68_05530 [Rhodospirillaceae bacterium TMED8]